MFVLVSYDVATTTNEGKRRLRRVSKACQDFGQRVQNSVFECVIDSGQWVELKNRLTSIIEPKEDSLRFYFLGSKWRRRVEHIGAKATHDPEGPIIV